MMTLSPILLLLILNKSIFAQSPSPVTSKKAILVDWAMRMWMENDLSTYVKGTEAKSFPVLRSGTELSLILPDDCPGCGDAVCAETTPVTGQRNKKILTRQTIPTDTWVITCKLFYDVELPSDVTGIPERRTLADKDVRTRGLTSKAAGQPPKENTPVIITPTIQGFGPELSQQQEGTVIGFTVDSSSTGEVTTTTTTTPPPVRLPKVVCDSLFITNAESFFSECCIKSAYAESDSRCALKTLLQMMEAQQPAVATTVKTTTTIRTVKKVTEAFGVTEADIDIVEELLDATSEKPSQASNAEETFSPSDSEKIVWTLTGQISSWRSKYFTVLGFFLVFLVFFLLIIAALIYKLRASKTSPPTSPGAVSGCGSTAGGSGRYDINTNGAGERAPLTPATQQAQTFQY